MRQLTWLFFAIVLSTQLEGKNPNGCPLFEDLTCRGGNQDLIPILRVGITPRFFDDTSAFSLIGEVGRSHNRFNATLGFPLGSDSHRFKFGGEVLNQRLSYRFPYDNCKSWTRQYAAGGVYQFGFDWLGFKSLEIGGQWSNALGHDVHEYRRKRCHDRFENHRENFFRPEYIRRITSSDAYAFSAGLTLDPWFWATLSGAYVYDKVDYKYKCSRKKVVSGSGGTVFFRQRLSCDFSLAFKGEWRAPYDYYEGRADWRTILSGTDVIIGIFGGHTQGKRSLPNSTIAGLEIGFDFGLTDYSMSRSVGLCNDMSDRYCQSSFGGLDRHYLEWLAAPAVYLPQVLAVGEQYRDFHPHSHDHHGHHHGHHHGGHHHDGHPDSRYSSYRYSNYEYDGGSGFSDYGSFGSGSGSFSGSGSGGSFSGSNFGSSFSGSGFGS